MTFMTAAVALASAAVSSALCGVLVKDKQATAACIALTWSLLAVTSAANGLHYGLADHGAGAKAQDAALWGFSTVMWGRLAWGQRQKHRKLSASVPQDGTGNSAG